MPTSAEEPSRYAWSWRDFDDTKAEAEAEPIKVTKCPPGRQPRGLSARPKASRPAVFSRG